MNREIKYRGYDTINKRMWSWAELLREPEILRSFFGNEHYMTNPPIPFWMRMQYIGKADNNGIDLYDGDVLMRRSGEIMGYIEWDSHECAYVIETNTACGSRIAMEYLDHFEKIGNIHQNPNLLHK